MAEKKNNFQKEGADEGEIKKPKREPLAAVKGMYEILPAEAPWWDKFEMAARQTARFYGFKRIETGVVENADLFIRTVGEESEIVSKEMFYLKEGKGKWVLRPEGTAPAARASSALAPAGQNTATRTVLPVPAGSTVEPRTC